MAGHFKSRPMDDVPDVGRISKRLIQFSQWSMIEEVNEKLDQDISPNRIYPWILRNGFSISLPMLYQYAKLRKKAIVDGVSMQRLIGFIRKPIIRESLKTSVDKLKSEIDALDSIITNGYNNLQRPEMSSEITPNVLMAAIRLKNELTDGNHGFLTNFGMEHLRDIENAKYSLIIDHLISFIPEDKRKEAVDKIAIIEEDYYKTTDYYEEYLRAAGDLSEDQIQKKLEAYKLANMDKFKQT